MAETLITTVIPTFRRPVLLKRAIESVLAQSFTDLKVCVYDNASGDETEAIVRAFAERDSRVIYYKNTENIGPVANIMQGLNAVTTPFYSLLSDDDFLLPDFYQQAINALKTNPSAGFVCSKTIILDLIHKKIQYRNQDWMAGFYTPSNEIATKMYFSHFTTTGVLLSQQLKDSIGIFEPSGSDILYMTIASASLPFVVLDNYGAAITLHEESYSMIGEGIVKESVAMLYEHFLFTMNKVMSLSLASEQKVHLLMYVMKTYQLLFDTKKLNYFVNNSHEDGIDSITRLPSLLSNRGLMNKFYSLLPKKTYPLVTIFFKLTKFIKRLLNRKAKSDWIILPNEAYNLLETQHSDVSQLMPYLQTNK